MNGASLAFNASLWFDSFWLGCFGGLGPGRGLFKGMDFYWSIDSWHLESRSWRAFGLATPRWQMRGLRAEVTSLCSCPSAESGLELRSSLRILGLVVLYLPPWDVSKTVAANFLWREREENMFLLRLKQVVLVLSVGGLKWSECGWLFWGCFLKERKEF